MIARKIGLLGLALTLIAAGCSRSNSEAGPTAESAIQLTVENDIIPPISLSIFATSSSGARQLIGVVRPGETTQLRWDARGTDEYRFAAEPTGGRQLVSEVITLGGGDSALWDLDANLLTRM